MFQVIIWFLNIVGVAMLVAGIAISGMSIYTTLDAEQQAQFLENIKAQPVSGGLKAGAFIFSYMSLTPALMYDWFGDPDHHVWLLEQFPLFDKFDIFAIALFWIIMIPIARMTMAATNMNLFYRILIIIAIFTIGTFVFWLLWKTLLYFVMNALADDVGLTVAEVEALRVQELAIVEEKYGLTDYLLISFILSGAFLISLFGGRRREG